MRLSRLRPRLTLAALRIAVLAGTALILIGLAEHLTSWPLLTSTLGPTAYVFFAHPREQWSSVRNASVGHAVGILAGLGSLEATTGIHVTGSGYQSGAIPHVVAASLALAITLGVLTRIRIHHAPAGASALLVATGLAAPGLPLLGLIAGLAALIALQFVLNMTPAPRLAQG